MKSVQLATFAAGLATLLKNESTPKDVTIKMTSKIDGKNIQIYAGSIPADQLQVGNFNDFRKGINELSTSYNGINISENDTVLEIAGKKFAFKGGKFASKINALVNNVVLRSGTLGVKKALVTEAKKAVMEKFVPKDASLLQWLDASDFLNNYTDSELSLGASILRFTDGEIKMIETPKSSAVSIEATTAETAE